MSNNYVDSVIKMREAWGYVAPADLLPLQEKSLVSKMSKSFSTKNAGKNCNHIKSQVELALKTINSVSEAISKVTEIVTERLEEKNGTKGYWPMDQTPWEKGSKFIPPGNKQSGSGE